MKIHHLNCGTLNAPLVNIASIVYCLLVETSQGLVLIDTGFGTQDYLHPNRKMRFFLNYMGVPRLDAETAISQVQSLGFNPADVKHIIQTHLHIDHAGGLVDFPSAEVHVFQAEYQAIQQPKGVMEFAYVQQHWAHHPAWKVHESCGEEWFGFEAVQDSGHTGSGFLFSALAWSYPGSLWCCNRQTREMAAALRGRCLCLPWWGRYSSKRTLCLYVKLVP